MIKLASRGRLIFVKDTTHMVELVLRKHICKEKVEKLSPGSRSMLTKLIHKDEDVEFYSCMLYIFSGGCIYSPELHGQSLGNNARIFLCQLMDRTVQAHTKKSLQRSKSLRKSLFTD